MAGTRSGARVSLAREGAANVETGLSVLDHLVGELARAGRFRIALEAAPDSTGESVSAAASALGSALAERLRAADASGVGWSFLPAEEALASAALERTDAPRFVTNVDFSDIRVGGVSDDVATRFLGELARTAGVNLHVRVLEGDDPQHVLVAVFKAVGASFGQACRPAPTSTEES
jgi:imidazoleglycerol-phosphate dehydratase/histidinol-phosphatase